MCSAEVGWGARDGDRRNAIGKCFRTENPNDPLDDQSGMALTASGTPGVTAHPTPAPTRTPSPRPSLSPSLSPRPSRTPSRAPVATSAAPRAQGACGRTAGAAAAVTVTAVNVGTAVTGYGPEGDTEPLPMAIAAMPSGGSWLAWLGTNGRVYLGKLDCDDHLAGTMAAMRVPWLVR